MRTPVELLWKMVGDAYSRHFQGRKRRKIEAFWQALKDMAADGMAYADHLKRLRNIFEADPYAPWGRIPFEPNNARAPVQLDAVLQNGFDGPSSWEWWAWSNSENLPRSGSFSVGNARLDFERQNAEALQSGGSVLQMPGFSPSTSKSVHQKWDMEHAPGYIFGPHTDFWRNAGDPQRWENQGTAPIQAQRGGLHFDVQGLNWGILHDRKHMDGAENWRQVWKLRVESWPRNDKLQSITVSSFGDVGEDYHIRLSDDQGVQVEMGSRKSGTQHQLKISGDGEVRGWRDKLTNASPSSPVDIEFVLSFDASKNAVYGEVWLNDEVVRQSNPFSVPPGRRSHTFDMFNEWGDVSGVVEALVVTEGRLW